MYIVPLVDRDPDIRLEYLHYQNLVVGDSVFGGALVVSDKNNMKVVCLFRHT